jgi:hypothetical protein
MKWVGVGTLNLQWLTGDGYPARDDRELPAKFTA